MNPLSNTPKAPLAFAMLVFAAPGAASAQEMNPVIDRQDIVVTGERLLPDESAPVGPEIKGIISARNGNQLQVMSVGGERTLVTVTENTRIKASGGFLGLKRDALRAESLLNGLPVTIDTVQWNGGLFASQIALKSKDLKTATMIRSGTEQRFGQQGAAISKNKAATEALRGRFGDIDQYNLKGTTNVYFDTGKHNLSAEARRDLCYAAGQAEAMDNALLLVVGYTDSTGSYEVNQALSERRAGRVVNFLQQQCGWKPYRMLTPTGMAASDPAASNDTESGKAQNRRVAVNILVSKSVDGM